MDTSIIVVIAIAVVFVVVVPAIVRRSATELSRADLDRLPVEAQVVPADGQNPCRDKGERVSVFRAEAVDPTVPQIAHTPAAKAPGLKLSAAPELAVIVGDAEAGQQEAEAHSAPLPVAVGETGEAFVAAGHAPDADNVRPLHPAVHAVFAQAPPSPTNSVRANLGQDPAGRGAGGGRTLSAAQPRREPAGSVPGARGPSARAGGGFRHDSLGDEGSTKNPQMTTPTTRPDEETSMTESAAPLRESLRSIGAMVRGFAMLFLGSVLGVLVTGVLALFSVVHPALIGVFAGLAVVALVIVRSLNIRKRQVKKSLRATTAQVVEAKDGGAAERSQTAAAVRSTAAQSGSTMTVKESPAAKSAAPATKSGPSASVAASVAQASTSSGSAKAARARAVMQRSATAKYAREEAVTGEVPIVRIRNEASEGHRTRQVLLTGPIPVIDEAAVSSPAGEETTTVGGTTASEAAESGTTASEATTPAADAGTTAESEPLAARDEPAAGVADDLADVAADLSATGSTDAPAASVNDPFQQRLKTRDGWSPTPLPVPSYVEAPEAEHAVPTPKAADASSYETEARSREDIAAEFAEELGYRAELSDSAREDSPLEHGRKAIRADKAPALDVVDDVLARRRA